MMKALMTPLLAVLLIAAFSAPVQAQKRKKQEKVEIPSFTINETSGLVEYKEAVKQAGAPDKLYDKGNGWFSSFYKSPSSVVKNRDKGNGVIEGVGLFWLKYTDPKTGKKRNSGQIQYKILLQFKDGRYRVTITDIIHKKASRYPIKNWIDANAKEYDHRTADFLVQVDEYFKNNLIPSLKKAMAAQPKAGGDDW